MVVLFCIRRMHLLMLDLQWQGFFQFLDTPFFEDQFLVKFFLMSMNSLEDGSTSRKNPRPVCIVNIQLNYSESKMALPFHQVKQPHTIPPTLYFYYVISTALNIKTQIWHSLELLAMDW